MEFKVVFYIILFVGYYAYQAYRKLKKNAEEQQQIPIPTPVTKPSKTRTEPQNPVFEMQVEKPVEYVSQYVSLEDMYAKKQFEDDTINNESGMTESDRKPITHFVHKPKPNKNKSLIMNNLKNKNSLQTAFLMQEVFQRKS
ncbi:MAG: hypothetical protein EAZ53_06685 [Bacteroidetes bacterium]|nr:MAG: hypothetical protein EAZ53_06685 [Bacteroidota bacterium]